MKKLIKVIICTLLFNAVLCSTVYAGWFSSFLDNQERETETYSEIEDIDSQIADLELQIEELQIKLAELKKVKASYQFGDIDSLFVETDKIFYVYTDSSGDLRYDIILEVTNTSSEPLYLKECTVDLEDSSGHLLQADGSLNRCPNVIMPGEKGYFYNQFGTDINSTVDINNVNVVTHYDIIESNKVPHSYPISDVSMIDDDFMDFNVIGRVENDTEEDTSLLYLNVLFYDVNNKIIGITGTNVDVKAGDTSSFKISGLIMQEFFDKSQISSYKILSQEYYYQFK